MAVERIRCIKKYQDFGFSIKEIKLLMSAKDTEYVEMMSSRVVAMKQQLRNLPENIRRAEMLMAEKEQI